MLNKIKWLDKKELAAGAILSLLFFGVNWILEFATDSYATFQEKNTWEWMLYENGRLFSALIYYLIENAGISYSYVYKLSWICAVVCLTTGIGLLAQLLSKWINSSFCRIFVSFLTIANYFCIEYFLFIEKGLFFLSILLSTFSVICTVRWFQKKRKLWLITSYVCLLISVFTYQIISGYYVILCLPFLLHYSSNTIKFLKNNLVVMAGYSLPLLLTYGITSVYFESSRIPDLSHNLFSTLENIRKLFGNWYHIPGGLLLFILYMLTFVIFFLIFRIKKREKKWIEILKYGYLVTGCVITSFFPSFTGVITNYSPRTFYPYGCLPGVLLIWLFMLKSGILHPKDRNKENVEGGCILLLLLLLWIQYTDFQSVFIERYRTNQTDYYYCQILEGRIKEYERKSGIIIDTLCFYRDASTVWNEKGYNQSGLMTRAQSVGWGNLNSINFYLDKEYTQGETASSYQEYFSQRNWDTYTEEQLIFEENTLHLCIY